MSKKFLLPIIMLLSLSACSGNDPVSSSINSLNPIIDDPVFKAHEITNPEKTYNNVYQKLDEGYVNSLKSFALDFYNLTDDLDNPVFSPVSIATCYSMLYDGALADTKAELKSLLHYDDTFNHQEQIQKMILNTAINSQENGTLLDLAQSLWLHDTRFADNINQDYFKKMQDYYFAEAYRGILESDEMHQMLADYINAKTHDFLKVKKDDFEEYEGVLWLLNTIYLKAKWMQEFPNDYNTFNKFANLNGSASNSVPYMRNTISSHYYKAENYMISSIPYKDGLTMSILLPDEGADYAKVLSDKTAIGALLEYYNTRNHMGAYITYQIPKFKSQISYDLVEYMKKLGLELCFDSDKANLFGLCQTAPKGNLYVKRTKHEAGIEVNNGGTEAAAYTIIEVDEKASPMLDPGEVKFICNHPFTYLISTNDGLPLFMGTVNKF